MLAQLERRPDVETAEVDRRGEHLRIRTRGPANADSIRDELERLGFAGEETGRADPTARWYGRSSVGELSREEGAVIAARVVPAFALANGLRSDEIDALVASVASALFECFVARRHAPPDPGGLVRACAEAVEGATRRRLGRGRALALARAVESDMGGAQRA